VLKRFCAALSHIVRDACPTHSRRRRLTGVRLAMCGRHRFRPCRMLPYFCPRLALRVAPPLGTHGVNSSATLIWAFIPSCLHWKRREASQAAAGISEEKMVPLMIGVVGVSEMTKPIAIGLFVVALFVAAYLVNRPQA
jgi:hypothetical protein